jgi:small subunit ribosomal protein S1
MIVDALVKKVNKGGLEVTVNGIRAFLPAGQIDLVHVGDLSSFVGKSLRCQVTEVSLSEKNLIVSRKAVLEEERRERAQATLASLHEGQICDGVVKSIKDFGAFVDIGGVDGLIHIGQLSWTRVKHPSDVLSLGQQIKVVVLSHDPTTHKIGLGLRQLTESPWTRAAEKYRPGMVVPGRVTKLMEFGAFVELEPAIEGLIHISELAHSRVHRVSEVVREGQAVDVKVLEVEVERQRMSLSLKQAIAEAEPELEEEPPPALSEETEPQAAPTPAKPAKPLKGGLGGGGGPLFGSGTS